MAGVITRDDGTECKPCSRCKEIKDVSAFYKHKTVGWQPTCKMCQRAYNVANKEKVAAYHVAYRVANADRIRERKAESWQRLKHKYSEARATYRAATKRAKRIGDRLYRLKNLEKKRRKDREYRLLHLDKARAYGKAYYAENRAQFAAKSALYSRLNAHAARARTKAWALANPDRHRVHAMTRRAHKVQAVIGCRKAYTALVKWTRSAVHVKCYWCGNVTKRGARDLDHIIPLSRGGADSVANLCVSCKPCNNRKRAKLPEDFSGQSELRLA